ncbi:hypothetical protein CCR80_08235 [Rhodothalassium salexigens]|nr:hypothetical protein [Rhodothalassium salexigens]
MISAPPDSAWRLAKDSAMTGETFSGLYRHWAARGNHLYPSEFVVRTMLGSYPRHAFINSWEGQAVLDLGFGDGRNFPLLFNAGARVAGVEVTEDIVALARERFADAPVDLRVGTNARIPFEDQAFDAVLACHSCYYLEGDDRFDDNLAEIARVLRPGGHLIFSVPHTDNFIFRDAKAIDRHSFEIAADPYASRNGTRLAGFADRGDLELALYQRFTNVRLGFQDDDFYGIRVAFHFGVAQKRG